MHELKWRVYTKPSKSFDVNEINKMFVENDSLEYIFYCDKFILVAYKFDGCIDKTFNLPDYITDWGDVISFLGSINWAEIKIFDSTLIWIGKHNQCLEAFIKFILDGDFDNLPPKWYSTTRENNWENEVELATKFFKKNYYILIAWKFINPSNNQYELEFVYWFEREFITQVKIN